MQHGFNTVAYTQTDPPRAAPDRGRSLISTIALLIWCKRRLSRTEKLIGRRRGRSSVCWWPTTDRYVVYRRSLHRSLLDSPCRSCNRHSTRRTLECLSPRDSIDGTVPNPIFVVLAYRAMGTSTSARIRAEKNFNDKREIRAQHSGWHLIVTSCNNATQDLIVLQQGRTSPEWPIVCWMERKTLTAMTVWFYSNISYQQLKLDLWKHSAGLASFPNEIHAVLKNLVCTTYYNCDSSTIRLRDAYNSSTIQHPTRSYVLSSNNEHVNSFALL